MGQERKLTDAEKLELRITETFDFNLSNDSEAKIKGNEKSVCI